MKVGVFAVVLSALLAAAPALAQKGGPRKIQCWTDKSGQRMCGDRVPPEYADADREIMKGGRVVETKKILSAEEAIEEKRKQKIAQDERDAQAKRAAYDRALLETYRSAKDIETMRDERVVLVDSRIAALEKNSGDTNKGLEGLRARAAALQKDNKPADPKLDKQIKQYEKTQAQNQRALTRYKQERVDIVTKFGADLERYNALKGNKVAARPVAAPGSTAAPPGAATPAQPAQPAQPTATPAQPATPPAKAGG